MTESICPSCGKTNRLLWPEGCNNTWHREGISMFKQCGEIIWLSTDKVNTYCMREKGHPDDGPNHGHNIRNEKPVESCCDAMCGFAYLGVEHEHPDPRDLTKALVRVGNSKCHGVYGTNG